MKRLVFDYIRIFIIVALVMCLMEVLSVWEPTRWPIAYLTDSVDYISGNVGAGEIVPYIERAEYPNGATKLIIGDSVCHQMFSDLQELNDDYLIIGSNGAITMAGQYILFTEFIENHPDATDVYLFVLPGSLERSFDTNYGYQYAVMPFVETDTLKDLDYDTIDIMRKTYGSLFMRYKVVSVIDRSALDRKLYLNKLKAETEGYEQEYPYELADRYIGRINDICNENGIAFHMYPVPVCESSRGSVQELESLYDSSMLSSFASDFFDMIYYFDEEQAADGVHFSGEYADQKHYNELIRQMYSDTGLLETLRLE